VSGAERHDVKLLAATLDRMVAKRPTASRRKKQNLCADKGYAGEPARKIIQQHDYVPHVPPKGKKVKPRAKAGHSRARRWVVERTNSWLNRFRKLLVRFEKYARSYEGLLELACSLIVFRQIIIIYG
jgi:putative transposase